MAENKDAADWLGMLSVGEQKGQTSIFYLFRNVTRASTRDGPIQVGNELEDLYFSVVSEGNVTAI